MNRLNCARQFSLVSRDPITNVLTIPFEAEVRHLLGVEEHRKNHLVYLPIIGLHVSDLSGLD